MNEGKLIQVIGPVVDVEFAEGELPEILTALHLTNSAIDDTEDNLKTFQGISKETIYLIQVSKHLLESGAIGITLFHLFLFLFIIQEEEVDDI